MTNLEQLKYLISKTSLTHKEIAEKLSKKQYSVITLRHWLYGGQPVPDHVITQLTKIVEG